MPVDMSRRNGGRRRAEPAAHLTHPAGDVDRVPVGRPIDRVEVLDRELVVGVEHQQVVGIGSAGDGQHGVPNRQRLAAMGQAEDLQRQADALRRVPGDPGGVVGRAVVGKEDGDRLPGGVVAAERLEGPCESGPPRCTPA